MLALVARLPQKGFQWATDIVGVSPSLFTDEGADWGRSRRLVAPPLSGHNVRKMVPAITKARRSGLVPCRVAELRLLPTSLEESPSLVP